MEGTQGTAVWPSQESGGSCGASDMFPPPTSHARGGEEGAAREQQAGKGVTGALGTCIFDGPHAYTRTFLYSLIYL